MSEAPSREFKYRGYELEELQEMGVDELKEIMPARIRRTLERGLSTQHRKLLQRVQEGEEELRTHLRDMPILPNMVGKTFHIHNGKEFQPIEIKPKMIGHYLGEFKRTRKDVEHGRAGVGATRSSKFVPLK